MDVLYRDRWTECTDDALLIHWYYLWGTKRIPYQAIREVRQVPMGLLTGQGRIWGSTTLRYWASLDPSRRRKSKALILDTGHRVFPFISPDDPDAVVAVIRAHSAARVTTGSAVVA